VSDRLALVVGAGGVLGRALCDEFAAAGYRVVGLRRAVPAEPGAGTRIVACDLEDPHATFRVVHALAHELGGIDVAVCNAAHLVIAPFMELALEDFDESWRASVGCSFACARAVLPGMAERGHGALIVSGATGSVRGAARFAAFASAKFALRGLAQSLAREYQPAGVHVAHVVLDGVLRGSASERRFEKEQHRSIEPRAAAAVYRQIAEQPASAWTHELDLRPHSERF
jgi:NAD(P)-dependent dehydrogenase (short-subunit alcohol dehydrogenase family)